jgi:hypothetical protein
VLVSVFVGNDVTESLPRPRGLDPRRHALYLLCVRGWRLLRAGAPTATAPDRLAGPPLSEAAFRAVEARRLAVCLTPAPPGIEGKWQRALGDLDRIVGACRARGVPVAFVLIPDEFQVNPRVLDDAIRDAGVSAESVDLDLPQRRLRAFCSARGVPCLDLQGPFRAAGNTYAPFDTHWNARGNRLAAEHITAWLRRGLLPSTKP